MSEEVALDELRRCSGEQFDPAIVEVFCQLRAEARSQSQPAASR